MNVRIKVAIIALCFGAVGGAMPFLSAAWPKLEGLFGAIGFACTMVATQLPLAVMGKRKEVSDE